MVDAGIQTEHVEFSSPTPSSEPSAVTAALTELVRFRSPTFRRLVPTMGSILQLQRRFSRRVSRKGRLAPATVAPVMHVRSSVLVETSEDDAMGTLGEALAALGREAELGRAARPMGGATETQGNYSVSRAPDRTLAPVTGGTTQPAETPKVEEAQEDVAAPRTPEARANVNYRSPYVSAYHSGETVLAADLTPASRIGIARTTDDVPAPEAPARASAPSPSTTKPSPSVDPIPGASSSGTIPSYSFDNTLPPAAPAPAAPNDSPPWTLHRRDAVFPNDEPTPAPVAPRQNPAVTTWLHNTPDARPPYRPRTASQGSPTSNLVASGDDEATNTNLAITPDGWFLNPRRAPPTPSHVAPYSSAVARPRSFGWDGRLEEMVTRPRSSGGVAGPVAEPVAEPVAGTVAGPVAGPVAEPVAGLVAGRVSGPDQPGPGPSNSGLSATGQGGFLSPARPMPYLLPNGTGNVHDDVDSAANVSRWSYSTEESDIRNVPRDNCQPS